MSYAKRTGDRDKRKRGKRKKKVMYRSPAFVCHRYYTVWHWELWEPTARRCVAGSFILPVVPGETLHQYEQRGRQMALKRSVQKIEGGDSGAYTLDPATQKVCPTVFEYLTLEKWDDGSPRKPSSLSVFAQEGVFKCILRDKDQGLCLWVSSDTLSMLFNALEAALADPETIWRRDRFDGSDQGAKRTRKK